MKATNCIPVLVAVSHATYAYFSLTRCNGCQSELLPLIEGPLPGMHRELHRRLGR